MFSTSSSEMGQASGPLGTSALLIPCTTGGLNCDWNHCDTILMLHKVLVRILSLESWTIRFCHSRGISCFMALNICAPSLCFSTSAALAPRIAITRFNASQRISCCNWFHFCLRPTFSLSFLQLEMQRRRFLCSWALAAISES